MRAGVSCALLVVLLLTVSCAPIVPTAVDPASAAPVSKPGQKLTVTDERVVSAYELWGEVLLEGDGNLRVIGGGHLVTDRIILSEGCQFSVQGGIVEVSPRTYMTSTGITGSCGWFEVDLNSLIRVTGCDGGYDVASSRGCSVALDITCSRSIVVRNSVIDVRAGAGFSPPEALTDGDLDGHAFAGGDARLSLVVDGMPDRMYLTDCQLTVTAGDGGTAPDGKAPTARTGPALKGVGGGYTRGGDVSDRVGSGGNASARLEASRLEVAGTSLSVIAGDGGDAGDGGGTAPGTSGGGGGGGYSGGDGASGLNPSGAAGDGGAVSGDVGAGGGARLDVDGDTVIMGSSSLQVLGGDGGDAGNGGCPEGGGGGGGGGYSGGGGGGNQSLSGGTGGNVSGGVGAGGDATAHLEANESLDVEGCSIVASAGRGGDAGDGGDAGTSAGGGGGGLTGGGGGGDGPPDGSAPGNAGGAGGPVEGHVGSGGSASLTFDSPRFIALSSTFASRGGTGGSDGYPGFPTPRPDGSLVCGGGGGGFSAGGGGGAGHAGSMHGSGGYADQVQPGAGDGGDGDLAVTSDQPSIHAFCDITISPGAGGGTQSTYAEGPQGGSTTRETSYGERTEAIPMSEPILWNPGDREQVQRPPDFLWMPVYRSTDHGDVLFYRFTMSRDNHFSEVVLDEEVTGTELTIRVMEMGTYYWRAVAVYEEPWPVAGPVPRFLWFRYFNAPPVMVSTPKVSVMEGEPKVVYLGAFIHDPDTPDSELTLEFEDPAMQLITEMSVSIFYKQWVPEQDIQFWISDGANRVEGSIIVEVIDRNDDPVIMRVGGEGPPFSITMSENDDRWYMIEAEDPDGDELTFRLLNDWAGADITPSGNLHIRPPAGDLGWHSIRVSVSDGRGGIVSVTIMVKVLNAEDPPDPPEVLSPRNGSVFDEGEPIVFTVMVTDPDTVHGQVLTTTWTSDVSGLIGSRTDNGLVTLISTGLPPGTHRVTVMVDDGEEARRAYLDLTVVEGEGESPPPTSSDLWLYVLFPALFALMISIGVLAGYRSAKHQRDTEVGP